jgi:hypothetical protein
VSLPVATASRNANAAAATGNDTPGHRGEPMSIGMIRYRVESPDGEFLDEFSTNAPDFAKERIGRIRKYVPDLTVDETPDD